jgi:site-specific DNA-methyltransferase (adenine-specific)
MSKDGSNQKFRPNIAAKQWAGWGTALKPASEHWILVRKPCEEKTVAANVLKWGTGGINIDGCRIEAPDAPEIAVKCENAKSRFIGKYNNGKTSKNESRICSATKDGRFPSNLVLSHSPYCTDEQCDIECAIERLNGQSIAGGMHGAGKSRPKQQHKGDSGGASRFFYCAKVSSGERNAGLDDMPNRELRAAGGTTSNGKPSMEGRDRFGSIVKNHHPTVKPQKLMQYFCRLVTPPGGVVLDPFMGSGSTGLAAKTLGFEFLGIEKDPGYFEISSRRINGR